MKKQILLIFFVGLLFPAFSQNFRDDISGSNGVSKHFTEFSSAKQVLFNPKDVNHLFDFTGSEALILMRAETDALGNVHYRYTQTYLGIPVENAMYIIRTKAGKMVGASGEIVTRFDAQMANRKNINISAKDAVDIGLQHVHAQSYMWQDARAEEILKEQLKNKNATYYPTAKLVWYSSGENIDPAKLVLAYKVDIYATEPMSRAYYFIDAQSGKLIGQKEILHTVDAVGTANTLYSGTQTIHSDHFNGSYRLRDYSRGNGVTTYDWSNNKSDITSPSANFNLSGLPQNGLDAHWGVEMTYDFYLANFNRNSLDNNGILLNSYVNRGGFLYSNNASWDGTNMNYGKRSGTTDGVTAIDVTGHELTHGFTQYTSGLNYSGESGGMNESMSDIMGKSVQFWAKPNDKNWVLSNDMNWAIRDMSNPNAFKQPDCYGGLYWKSNADVHILSGVGNFMFYLLVDGGAGTNDIGNTYNVQGLGLSKADQIIYLTNTTYLVPNSKYADWRTACINAATDLYGSSSNEVTQVQNAWHAVGIGAAGGGGGTCTIPSGLSTSALTATSATLSWSNTGAVSYNLQWKATSSGTWTTVSGISGTSYNLSGLTSCTNYQFKVQSVCSSSSSAYSSVGAFQTTGCTGGSYCASSGNSTSYEYIKKVVLGSISNLSGDNGGYADYTSLSTNIVAGHKYRFKGKSGYHGSAYAEYWTVYIDYNHDGDFNDANETVANFTTSSTTMVTKQFTVPSGVTNGSTRMRVQMHYGSYITDPCATFDFGEVEDYTVNISGGSFSGFSSPKEETTNSILISPNPVSGASANLSYKIVKDGNIQVKVLNMNGQVLQNIDLGRQFAGSHNYMLNSLNKLASGTYMIVMEQDNQVVNRTRFVVTH